MALGFYWATGALCVFIAVLAADIMGVFSSKNHFEIDGRVGQHRNYAMKILSDEA
jgi:3-dehydrosphinganine reductase